MDTINQAVSVPDPKEEYLSDAHLASVADQESPGEVLQASFAKVDPSGQALLASVFAKETLGRGVLASVTEEEPPKEALLKPAPKVENPDEAVLASGWEQGFDPDLEEEEEPLGEPLSEAVLAAIPILKEESPGEAALAAVGEEACAGNNGAVITLIKGDPQGEEVLPASVVEEGSAREDYAAVPAKEIPSGSILTLYTKEGGSKNNAVATSVPKEEHQVDSIGRPKKLQDILNSCPVSNVIGNFCEYACPYCNFAAQTWSSLWAHSKAKGHHVMHGREGFRYLTKPVSYECRACKTRMLCENNKIYQHLSHHHKMSMAEYLTRFNLQSDAGKYVDDLDNFLKDVPVYPVQERINVDSHVIPREFTTYKIGNLCRFQCVVCQNQFTSWESVPEHNKTLHKMPVTKLTPDHIKEARYHRCLICSRNILCDKRFIIRHVERNHKLKLGAYIEKVKEITGETNVAFARKTGKNVKIVKPETEPVEKPEAAMSDLNLIMDEECFDGQNDESLMNRGVTNSKVVITVTEGFV